MKALTYAVAILAAISFNAFSQNVSEIPLPEEFVTTMDVTNEYPKVRTGYLAASINDIAKYYQHALGEPLNIKGDNNYRTLYYNYQSHAVRISLYHHNYVTEVSIMIE